MNYMIKSIAAKVISHFFCEYIDQIDSSQLELAIWDGKARLENVKIVKDALATHNLPFTVNNGSIGSISLLFPWSRLKSEPCVINVEDVFIVASVSGNILISKDLETRREVEKLHEEESTVSESGTFSSILSQIIDNIQFHIKNLHLRVEINVNNSIVAIGITISSINSFSVNEALEYAFISLSSSILRKKLEVSDLSIYIDPDQEPISVDNFANQMEKLIYGNHHYILRPFNFSGHIYFHRQTTPENQDNNNNSESTNTEENQDNTTEVHVNTQGINLALDELQWRGLMELERQYAMFNTRRKYSHCGKPTNYPRSDRSSSKWWRYAHRCAIDKTNKISFDVKNALNILVNRKKYVSLVESGDLETIKKFEKNFDLPIVLFLRNYAKAAKKSNKEEITQLSPEEIEAVMKEQKKLKSQTLSVVLKMGLLSISFLKKDLSSITRFLLTGISANYHKHKFNSQIELGIESLTVFNEMSEKFNKTLMTKGGVKFLMKSKPNKPNNINIETSGTTFIIDLTFLDQIVNFFKKEKKFILIDDDTDSGSAQNSEAKKQIQTVIDQYKGIDLNINVNDTSIILPYQEVGNCPLLALNCQKTVISSTPNKNLNVNDFNTLFDKFVIQFSDSMLYLDNKPLLFKKFDCNVDCLMAIVESNKIDGLKINCVFDQFLAHISTVQFFTVSNLILYLVNSIQSLFKKDKENELTNSNSIELTTSNSIEKNKSKSESKIRFTLDIRKIDFSVCIYTGKIFEFLTNNFDLVCLIDKFIDVQFNMKGFTGYEFLTTIATDDFDNNKFAYIEQLKFTFSDKPSTDEICNKIDVDVNNSILYAKQKCLLYIIELFSDPDNFERVFDNNETFEYSKNKHKMTHSSDSLMVVKARMNNTKGFMSTDIEQIGEVILKTVDVSVNIEKSWDVEVNVIDCLFKDKDQFIEIMDKTTLKSNPFLVQIERIQPIIATLNFDYVMNVMNYLINLTLSKEGEEEISSYSLMNINVEIQSIIGSFNEIKFNLNDIKLKGKIPVQFDFELSSFDALLNDTHIANVKKVSALMINEVIDKTLFDDTENFEKNKFYTQNFIESEKDSKLLLSTQFIICTSKAIINIDSLNFTIIPSILNTLPTIDKVKAAIQKERNNSNKIIVKKLPSSNSNQARNHKIKFIISFGLNAFSFALIEETKNLLSLNLNQIKYKDNTIKIDTFSLLSDGYEPIAICKENFFSCSDSLNLFKVQNIDFILDYNLFLTLTQYLLQFSPILSYMSLFQRNKRKKLLLENNDDEDTKDNMIINQINSIEADVNKFSFLIKEDDINLRLTIAFKIRPNHFEINELALDFIQGELTLPLLHPLSIQYEFDSKPRLSFSPLNLFFGIGDIKFIIKLANMFLSLLAKKKKNEVEQATEALDNNNGFDILSLLPQKLRIMPIKMNIGLCFNDRSPFVTLKVESSKISISKRFKSQLQLTLVYYNAETGNKDLLLEPLKIEAMISTSEKDQTIEVNCSPIILNVHFQFLRRLIYFTNRRKKELKIDYQSYKFVNKMHTTIQLKISQVMNVMIQPGESVPFSDVDSNAIINIKYENVHDEKFVISQLFYPTALSISCFVYRENNKIVFSPPYFFENSLNVPFNVYSGTFTKMNEIKPNERISFNSTVDIEQGFFFVIGQMNRPPTVKSISTANLSPFKTLSFGNLMNASNSVSIDNFLPSSPRSAEKKKLNEPSVYHFGSWTSSTPTTYTIVDKNDTNNNIVVNVRQRLERNFIGIIEILPILTIVNELPFDLTFCIPRAKTEILIKQGCSLPCPMNTLIYNAEGIIVAQLKSDRFGESPQTTILYRENSKTEIVLSKDEDKTNSLSLTANSVVTAGQAKLYIYSPAILINKCGYPLNIRRTSGSRPKVLDDYILMGSNSFVLKSTLKVQIQCEQYGSFWQKEKIDCTALGISSTVFLPTSNESIFVPIYVRNRKAKSPFNHTTVIVFSPALIFVNETNHHFILSPCTIDKRFWLKVGPKSRVPIIYSTSKSNFIVQIDDIDVGVKIVLASPIRQVFRFNNIYIEMETVLVSGTLSCHFRKARMPTPVVLSNMLKIPYSIYQLDSSNQIIVEPNSTSPFAYDDPFGNQSVILTIDDKKFNVKLNVNCEPTKIKDTNFYIEIKTAGKGHRMLIISDHNLAVSYETTFHFSLTIQDLLISLINSNMNELCLISFHNFCFKTSNEGENSLYEFTLDSFQIDDQLNIAPFPTLLIGNSNQRAKFLHCSAICYREAPLFSSFKNLTFSMQKICIYADMAFISDLYGVYKEIQQMIQKQKDKEQQLELNEERFRNSILFFEDKNENETELHVGKLISFNSLIIHPFLASVTYRGMSGRPNIMPKLELPVALTIIPNITNASLSLKSFQVNNFLAPIALLKENIFEGYKNEIIMESWQIAGHSDIFFNVFGIAETFGNGFKSMFYDPNTSNVGSPEQILKMITKGSGQLIFGTLGSIIQGGEGFIKNISSFLSMIGEEDTTAATTDNTNLNAADTFSEGINSLGNGFIEGISGLITKPVEGGKKDGILGAMTGLAKGVIGVVTKPAAGLLDMSAGIIGGLRKTISSNDDIVKRFREPNSFSFAFVGGFNNEVSKIQAYVQKYNKKKKYYLMSLMAINYDKNFIYALFDKRIFFFEIKKNTFEYSSKKKVSKITNISQAGKKVIFQIVDDKKIIFECPNQEMAEKFVIVLNSLVVFAKCFK